jgi:hypothetical protein
MSSHKEDTLIDLAMLTHLKGPSLPDVRASMQQMALSSTIINFYQETV